MNKTISAMVWLYSSFLVNSSTSYAQEARGGGEEAGFVKVGAIDIKNTTQNSTWVPFSLEQKVHDFSPEEKCWANLKNYRMADSGWSGIVGRTQHKLVESEHVAIRKGNRAYGRQELVDSVNYAACVMYAVFDVPLEVHDLSREGGGKLYPHKSHRNGRDADVGLYGYNDKKGYYNSTQLMKRHGRVHADFNNEKALEANWLFIDGLLSGPHQIEAIFVDQVLKNRLREYVVRTFDEKTWERAGRILQHEPGHTTHYHIRTSVPYRERPGV